MKEKGLAPVFVDSRLEHPAGWICAHYKSSVIYNNNNNSVKLVYGGFASNHIHRRSTQCVIPRLCLIDSKCTAILTPWLQNRPT